MPESDWIMFLIFLAVVCGPVILFWGPAMWSSDSELLIVKLWRKARGRKKTPPPLDR